MEKALSKQLERIRKVADKGAYEKALSAAEEALLQFPQSVEVMREQLRATLHARPWSDVLHLLKRLMARQELSELLLTDSRTMLMHVFVDNAPFRGALLDYLLNIQAFGQIAYILKEIDDADRVRLIEGWSALSSEIQDEVVAISWMVATGLGAFVMNDYEVAWESWQNALKRDPRYLKKIMSICNREPEFDLTKLHNRLRVIRLIVAAGKRDESLNLLQVLGLESRENALGVLIEIPEILADSIQERDVCQLRFNLASQLEDQEVMGNVLADMLLLTEDELFSFQKQALVNLENRELKRYALTQISELYIKRGLWEPAAMLLESLHQEDEHPEVVALMEYVLDSYPILPHLHLTVANYQVRNGYKENALRHLTLIKQVSEFSSRIRTLLETTLIEKFDPDYGQFLFDILPQESAYAAVIALRLCVDCDQFEEGFYERLLVKAPQSERGPLWLLALAQCSRICGRREQAIDLLAELIDRYPELAPEVIQLAEQLSESPGHLQALAKAITEHKDELEPRDLWVIVKKQCERAFPAIETQPVAEKPDRDTTVTDAKADKSDKSPFSKGLNDITAFVADGEFQAAAQLAERLAEKFPDRFRIVLACLDRFRENEGQQLLWDKCRLNILIRAEAYDEAAEFGKSILHGPVPQKQLAAVQQLVAFAHEGRGEDGEALKFFCLSSKNQRFYAANRSHIIRLLFPKHQEMIQEVLHVIMLHKDSEAWQQVMADWSRNESGATDEMMRWQMRFAQHTRDPHALIDVAKWAFEEGRKKEAHQALGQLSLKQDGIENALLSLVEVAKNKHPKDAHSGFLLGRHYLVRNEVAKSVSAFRDLVARVPESAPKIYDYLHKFIEVHPEHDGNLRLYGLLIRVGLDVGYYKACVEALATFGEKDRVGALTLSDGISRVLLDQSTNAESLILLMEVFSSWREHNRVVDLAMRGDFARVGLDQRVSLLQKAAEASDLEDSVQLALARLFFSVQEFDRCRASLGLIQDDDIRGQALDIYDKLVERFPHDLALVREAGWASWLNGRYDEAVRHFSLLVSENDPTAAIEAFAILSERDVPVSLSELLENTGLKRNDALIQVNSIHGRIQEMDLLRWERSGGPIPYDAMEWLLANGDIQRFAHLFDKMRSFVDRQRGERLHALYLCAQGRPYFGAMRLAQGANDTDLKRSMLASCGLHETALLIRDETRITPLWLKRSFLAQYGSPKRIVLRAQHARAARVDYAARLKASAEADREQS